MSASDIFLFQEIRRASAIATNYIGIEAIEVLKFSRHFTIRAPSQRRRIVASSYAREHYGCSFRRPAPVRALAFERDSPARAEDALRRFAIAGLRR